MRMRLPTSQAALKIRFSILDFVWAIASPILALALRDAYILTYENAGTVALYCIVWVIFTLISFLAFRLYDGLTHHFSVHDALDVLKAVIFTELFTCLVFFTVSRLVGIPRSALIIHALILATGLIATRALAQAFHNNGKATNGRNHVAHENIIMIGATHVSSLYIKLLEACSPGERRVIAMLDNRPQLIGRSMSGIRILAVPHHLNSVIEEFVVHGINTDRVIIGDDEKFLDEDELKEIQRVCEHRQIKLNFLSQLIGLDELAPAPVKTSEESENTRVPNFELPRYFKYKPFFDFIAAMALIILLLPLLIVSAALTLLDVGSPVLFWQQRIGQGGRRFMLQKFRTLRAPYDWHGEPVPNRNDLSLIGRLLRQTRLDELPQLLNILVGDMALIGPRPLLPEDQPTNPVTRLMVRPGITGWAQVNGGKFLTPQEKDQYDEFYIRNASPWFDLRIVFMTLRILFRFTAHTDHEVAADCVVGFGKAENQHSTVTVHRLADRVRKAQAPRLKIESPPIAVGTSDVPPSKVRNSNRKTQSPNR